MRSVFALALFVVAGIPAGAESAPGRAEPPRPIEFSRGGDVLTSTSSAALAARETTGPDTFVLYGGPDHPTEGKFQLADGVTPDWGGGNGLPGNYGGGPQAWTPVDLTDEPEYWNRSTFNADNLGGHGPGNHAMWCGLDAGDPLTSDWNDPPGYGNNWDSRLLYESAEIDFREVGQTVALDFLMNHDVEPWWDFLSVEYDSAGTWVRVCELTGSSADSLGEFAAPGLRFSDVQERPIFYAGEDYGWAGDNRIRIRIRVTSDGAWSDEDGLWPTVAGAAQVDDISLTTSQGSWTEDYESTGPWLFNPERDPFAGDFADVYPAFTDIDPCRENPTPVVGFIDYDQIVRNGPALDGVTWSTGGSTSPGVEYGIPGNYVVNVRGGLSYPTASGTHLLNAIWSPVIEWNLPGADDDGVDVSGAILRFDVWPHLPLVDAVFYLWDVRSARPGEAWSDWKNHNLVGYGGPEWESRDIDVTPLLEAGCDRVQVSLTVWEYPYIDWPSEESTPAPIFDNVTFLKYRVGGPVISARTVDLAQDGFPPVGHASASSQADRDALDVPFDMARDINSGSFVIDPGDSVVFEVTSTIPGAEVADIRMVWALQTSALFEDAIRAAPARPHDEFVMAGAAGTVWTGQVVADSSRSPYGVVENRFFVDLPDEDFLYPGDVLHYYLQATDSDGRVTTLPADLHDFADFSADSDYDRRFVVRGLPSLRSGGAQPTVLVINDHGHGGDEAEWVRAFRELGLQEGVHFDSYTVKVPAALESNGIGSTGGHGANHWQLADYEILLYLSGDLETGLLSPGEPFTGYGDKGNDLSVIDQWLLLPLPRHIALFGDNVATAIAGPYSSAFMDIHMGVGAGVPDVRPLIGGQVTPTVAPNAQSSFAASLDATFVAYGGCPGLRTFDQIQPLPGAEATHWFTDAAGAPITDPAAGVASVAYVRPNGVSLTFPYAWSAVYPVLGRAAGLSVQAQLLADMFDVFAAEWVVPPYTDAPPQRRSVELSVAPNPFNPRTTIEFTAPAGSRGTVKVYNLRGELVRMLHSGEYRSTRFVWDGHDRSGAAVASGVYVVRAEADGVRKSAKVALVK